MNSIDRLLGTDEGSGSWHDSAGQSASYTIRRTIPIGNGYVFGAYCHYHLKVGDKLVEAGYRASGDELEAFGSGTSNAEGHYIAWTERLRRIP